MYVDLGRISRCSCSCSCSWSRNGSRSGSSSRSRSRSCRSSCRSCHSSSGIISFVCACNDKNNNNTNGRSASACSSWSGSGLAVLFGGLCFRNSFAHLSPISGSCFCKHLSPTSTQQENAWIQFNVNLSTNEYETITLSSNQFIQTTAFTMSFAQKDLKSPTHKKPSPQIFYKIIR